MSRRRARKFSKEPVMAEIDKLSHEGRGIAIIDGKTTFIRGALPGERVMFQYTSKRGQFDEGQVLEVLQASPDRVQAKCAVFGICGGCGLQHLTVKQQIAHKQSVLVSHFQHFGHNIKPEEWLAPLQVNEWGYRYKARLGMRNVEKKGGVLVGFRETNGRYLTDMNRCEVMHPSIGGNIQAMRQWLNDLDAKTTIPQIEVAIDDYRTAIIIRHLEALSEPDKQKIIAFAKEKGWWVYLQSKGPDTVRKFFPDTKEVMDDRLSYSHPNHTVDIFFQPQDFTQVNLALNRAMVDLVIGLLDLQQDDKVLDLFCGLGNFTLPLARYVKWVVGVEGDEPMTQRALQNAQHNGITNVEFHVANLFEDVSEQSFIKHKYDKVLLDPPRAGAEAIMHQLKKLKAKRIVYVSCNPATLARDAGILVNDYGYKLVKAGVMDMFPHTAHVESIALFEK